MISGTLKQSAFLIPLGEQQKKSQASVMQVSFQKINDQKHLDSKVFKLDAFSISNAQHHAEKTKKRPTLKLLCVAIVVLGHLLVGFMLMARHDQALLHKPTKPITVSIVAAPESDIKPEIVPIIESVKIAKKTVVKPRKIVEKIVTVENPTQPLFEATTEPGKEKFVPVEEVPVPVVVAEKAAAITTLVEERMELPKFGVAYLNNPAPDYPGISRRVGEEGRVLLKVLVSAIGDVENVEVEKSSHFDRLDQAAISAVKRWRFIPARKGGQALSAYVLVPVKFSLNN